ncbi:Fic family protein [Candidatus Symbiobacter mobilis]|uniref:Transcriptional regulator-like protein n=1 Tax=Candidatus Symbiobacter mobilis CR TaxID=946483 RepID=U5NCD2_9BURK|nr:hypothetical protein [Candidatus Symbiobacter mobilis]AGX87824.1 transcriptional regulator-like protein [Candidatus Symbiobacter mobilis CR]
MTAQELFEQLQLLDETERIEAKSASQVGRSLLDAGLFAQKGRGSATWYQPTDHMLAGSPSALSRDPDALSRDSKVPEESIAAARQALLATLPGNLGAQICSLGQRSPPHAVRKVVLHLLRHRACRLEELGLLLGRNPEYVRQKYVHPLLEAGHIAMTWPDKPNDPTQAYRAVNLV